MTPLQTSLCTILHRGLHEQARLVEAPSPRLDAVIELADALDPLPAAAYKWRRLSVRATLHSLARHQRLHRDCPNDYGALLAPIRAPRWQVWSHGGVRDTSVAGPDDLPDALLYLLAVERTLLRSIRTAAALQDVEQLLRLGQIAGAVPEMSAELTLGQVEALAGKAGPFAVNAPCWMVFQPLTIPVDEVPRKYLR